MKDLCEYLGWEVPQAFSLRSLDSLAVMLHWRVLGFLVGRLTCAQAEEFRALSQGLLSPETDSTESLSRVTAPAGQLTSPVPLVVTGMTGSSEHVALSGEVPCPGAVGQGMDAPLPIPVEADVPRNGVQGPALQDAEENMDVCSVSSQASVESMKPSDEEALLRSESDAGASESPKRASDVAVRLDPMASTGKTPRVGEAVSNRGEVVICRDGQ